MVLVTQTGCCLVAVKKKQTPTITTPTIIHGWNSFQLTPSISPCLSTSEKTYLHLQWHLLASWTSLMFLSQDSCFTGCDAWHPDRLSPANKLFPEVPSCLPLSTANFCVHYGDVQGALLSRYFRAVKVVACQLLWCRGWESPQKTISEVIASCTARNWWLIVNNRRSQRRGSAQWLMHGQWPRLTSPQVVAVDPTSCYPVGALPLYFFYRCWVCLL